MGAGTISIFVIFRPVPLRQLFSVVRLMSLSWQPAFCLQFEMPRDAGTLIVWLGNVQNIIPGAFHLPQHLRL